MVSIFPTLVEYLAIQEGGMFTLSTYRRLALSVVFTASMVMNVHANATEFPKRAANYSTPAWERVIGDATSDPGAGYASAFRRDRCVLLRTSNRLRQAEGCAFVDGQKQHFVGDVQRTPAVSTFRRDMCAALKTNNRLWRDSGCRFAM